jgi:multidrug efflux pump subunit AcrA (membrane-fusion protein)
MAKRYNVVKPMALVLGLLLIAAGTSAQEVERALSAAQSMDDAARRSQTNIDQTVDETRSLERQYSAILKEIDGLEVYNALLEKQLESQDQEMADLNRSIDQVSVIERQVTPLMGKMIDALEQFVELDVPFLLEERRRRVAFLRTMLERSDVTVAEKFRRLLEAYEIENDYGRTIEAYKGSLEVDGASREVDFLRIGRTILLYQTVDAEIFGMWDRNAREWVSLPAEYRNQIRAGIRMAHKQIAPDLLLLPIPAPETAE